MEKSIEIPKFPYSGNERRLEIWERPIKVVNAVELNGLPTKQNIKSKELTPNQAIEIDNRALLKQKCVSICYGRPHGGEFVPQELWTKATEAGKKMFSLPDRGTPDIFISQYIPSVGTKISRWVVDPNRAPLLEINPTNPKVPGKVLWYNDWLTGEPVYQEGQEPSKDEVEQLAEKLYLPYFNDMMATIGSLADRRKSDKERILVIDGHSFPTHPELKGYYDKYGIPNFEQLPLFIIGNRDGESCDADIVEAFIKALENNFNKLDLKQQQALMANLKSERLVGQNYPFKGVHNVLFYGQRQRGINALQVELNESGYMVEDRNDVFASTYNEGKMDLLRRIIEQSCLEIDPLLKGK